MNFPARLREARKSKGYSMKKVAELVGLARPTYSCYEYGTREPSLNTIAKLIKVLDIDANYLFSDDVEEDTIVAYTTE